MSWREVSETKPETGTKVLVWFGEPVFAYGIGQIAEDGSWVGGENIPSHWMPFPDPPGGKRPLEQSEPFELKAEIVDDRLMLDIDEEKETVAHLMQHFINGQPAVINQMKYFVVDISNEMTDDKMLSVFSLKKA